MQMEYTVKGLIEKQRGCFFTKNLVGLPPEKFKTKHIKHEWIKNNCFGQAGPRHT